MPDIYPKQIQYQIDVAKREQSNLIRWLKNHPPSGRERVKGVLSPTLPIAIGQDPESVSKAVDTLHIALGPRARGNKRWGQKALYLDLVQYFFELKNQSISLPRQHLSAAAAQPKLEQILIRHGYLRTDESGALENAVKRDQIGRKMARIFIRIADAVIQHPPQ